MDRETKESKFYEIYSTYIGSVNLVLGCGVGNELEVLADQFPKAFFYGIDIELDETETGVNWTRSFQDGHSLEFLDKYFDFVYCFHVLEHVRDPNKVVSEIARVLNIGSRLFIGTPNRQRVFGYFSSDASLKDKIKWNVYDWRARLAGKFENRYGAHAGFETNELEFILRIHFQKVHNRTLEYYILLYPRYQRMITLLDRIGILARIAPSIYFEALQE